MTVPDPNAPKDPLIQSNEIDQICDQFEQLWQQGHEPRIEDFLSPNFDPAFRAQLFTELVRVDCAYRISRGETPTIDDYSTRFPEFSEVISSILSEGGDAEAINWHPQQRLGPLVLQAQVGQGAFGQVWKAWDTELERLVAVKLPTNRSLGSRQISLFQREAKAAAKLHHHGIVPVYGFGLIGGKAYITSHFVDGMPLSHWLEKNKPTTEQAAEMCKSIAEALDHAHSLKVIHRDLKPSNVLIDGMGKLHVTDFGLAKRLDANTSIASSGALVGTLSYMSPEQARGDSHRVDGRTDVYALGVILYQMLTGRVPFTGEAAAVLDAVLHKEPVAPRRRNCNLHPDIEKVCLKAIAKEPGDRYATAQAFADDLGRFLEGKPVLARPISPASRLFRRMKRRPWLTASFSAFLLAVTGLLLLFLSRSGSIKDGKWEVAVTTNPPGAQVIAFPRDRQTNEIRRQDGVASKECTPVSLRLSPGDYHVVVQLPGTNRFHEVERTVPPLNASIPHGVTKNRFWRRTGPNSLEWPEIDIPSTESLDDMIYIPSESFRLKLPEVDPSQVPNDFYIRRKPFTNGDIVKLRPWVSQDYRDRLGSADLPFHPQTRDLAIHWAECAGGRLPTSLEWQYAVQYCAYAVNSIPMMFSDSMEWTASVPPRNAEHNFTTPILHAIVCGIQPENEGSKVGAARRTESRIESVSRSSHVFRVARSAKPLAIHDQ